jgi:hypothetical protein
VKRFLELVGRTLPLVFLVAHCATEADSGSQTHWLGTCIEDAECGAGLVCRCARCMKECTDGSCANLGRPAECATPGSPAHGADCSALETMTICVPQCTGGCASNEECVAGICVARWLGPPCDECDLPTQVARLAEPGSEDCGTAYPDAGNTSGADCAITALQAGRPFTVINPPQVGTDSYVSSAMVFAEGRLYLVHFDSSVCGGGPSSSCETLSCGPWMQRSICVDPDLTTIPGAIAGCASLIDPQVICGPNPRCYGGVCQ